jgi:hypothetical protein
MNEPSKEAMAAATEIYDATRRFVTMVEVAQIIDRHFPRKPSAAWMELLWAIKEHNIDRIPPERIINAIAAVENELKEKP